VHGVGNRMLTCGLKIILYYVHEISIFLLSNCIFSYTVHRDEQSSVGKAAHLSSGVFICCATLSSPLLCTNYDRRSSPGPRRLLAQRRRRPPLLYHRSCPSMPPGLLYAPNNTIRANGPRQINNGPLYADQ
jgi:hypothetical protein